MRFLAPVFIILLCSIGMSANATTMQDLLNGGIIQEGDLLFFDFSGFSSIGARPVAPNQITVSGKNDKFGPGLVFDSFAFVVAENEAQTTSFMFLVRSLSDEVDISDAELSLKVTGEATAVVSETVADQSGATLGSINAFSRPSGQQLSATTRFTPQTVIMVDKTIKLDGNAVSGERIDEFRQDFSTVPEPSSGLLAITGLLFLIGVSRAIPRCGS